MKAEDELFLLAFDFFKLFSRFEFCLKASGYFRKTRSNGVEADWDRFASDTRDIISSPDLIHIHESVNYFSEFPPKKQIVDSGVLKWGDVNCISIKRNSDIFLCIRRVRNNLFHGGKFNGHWMQPERSEMLIKCSIKILKASLDISPKIKEIFDQRGGV